MISKLVVDSLEQEWATGGVPSADGMRPPRWSWDTCLPVAGQGAAKLLVGLVDLALKVANQRSLKGPLQQWMLFLQGGGSRR